MKVLALVVEEVVVGALVEAADGAVQLIVTSVKLVVAWVPATLMVEVSVAHHLVKWVATVLPHPMEAVAVAMAVATVEAATAILEVPQASPGGRLS